VNEEGLKSVYAFDNSLLAYEDQLASGLRAFGDAIGTEQVSAVIDQLDALVTELSSTFAKRIDAMQGLAQSV
jgi:hypothetical protein